MENNKQYSIYEIEESFHTFLQNFDKETRFFNPINWDFSYCIQTTNNKRKINKEQQKIIGDNND